MTPLHATKIKWVCIGLIVLSLMFVMKVLPFDELRGTLSTWIQSLGPLGPIAFGAIYAIATVCFLPGSFLTLAAGALFGLWLGFIVVSISSVAGATMAFLIARYFARSKIEELAGNNPKFAAIDEAISEGGWKIVALLRLSPALPFNLQNYLYGLTDIKTGPYVLTSWLAMMPGTLMYVYLGHIAGVAATGGKKSPGQWALLIVGLLATVAVTVYVTKLAGSKLKEKTEVESESAPVEEQPHPESEVNLPLPWIHILLAVVFVGLAIFSVLQKEVLENWIRSLVG